MIHIPFIVLGTLGSLGLATFPLAGHHTGHAHHLHHTGHVRHIHHIHHVVHHPAAPPRHTTVKLSGMNCSLTVYAPTVSAGISRFEAVSSCNRRELGVHKALHVCQQQWTGTSWENVFAFAGCFSNSSSSRSLRLVVWGQLGPGRYRTYALTQDTSSNTRSIAEASSDATTQHWWTETTSR